MSSRSAQLAELPEYFRAAVAARRPGLAGGGAPGLMQPPGPDLRNATAERKSRFDLPGDQLFEVDPTFDSLGRGISSFAGQGAGHGVIGANFEIAVPAGVRSFGFAAHRGRQLSPIRRAP